MTSYLSNSEVISQLSTVGFCHIRNFLSSHQVTSILEDVSKFRFSFNSNKPGGVSTPTQYYNTSLLSISSTFFDVVTGSDVQSICSGYFPESNYRLRCHRYYETYGNHFMQWHRDMKIPLVGFKNIPGLIFIIYMSEVVDGEFQYISGSHKYFPAEGNYDFTDAQILDMFGAHSVISFAGSPGDLIVYNTAGIHRAKPVLRSNFSRSSLFFQIDSGCNDSEPTYINPSFVNPLNTHILNFLGFGQPSTFPEYPSTSITTASSTVLFTEILMPYILYLPKRIYRKLISQLVRTKRLLRRF